MLAALLLHALLVVDEGMPGDAFSLNVCLLGDIDNDCIADYLIADHVDADRPTRRGRVWAISGRDLTVIHSWVGAVKECLGSSMGAMGDVNLDGVPDVFIAARNDRGLGVVKARIYSGKSYELIYELESADGSEFLAIDDIDGDRVPDFLLAGLGVVARSGRDGRVLWRRSDPNESIRLGRGLALSSDFDADGHADIVVGASCHDRGEGYVEILAAQDGKLIRRISAPDDAEHFTEFASGNADVDGDGMNDVVAVDYGLRTPIKRATLYSGRSGERVRDWTIDGDPMFESTVIFVPDVNDDGTPDLLFSSPTTWPDASKIVVFSGLDSTLIWSTSLDGRDTNNFGCSIALIPDRDGDGVKDLLVGEASERHHGWRGTARLLSGRNGGVMATITRASLRRSALIADRRPVESLPPLVEHPGFLDKIHAHSISPDQRKLALATVADGVCFLDLATKQIVTSVASTGWPAVSTAWKPDGTELVVLHSDSTVECADASTGAVRLTFHAPHDTSSGWNPREVRSVAGGAVVLVALGGGPAQLFAASDGKLLAELAIDAGSRPTAVAVSRNGERVALGDGASRVAVWNARTGQREDGQFVLPTKGPVKDIVSLDFDPNGEVLAIGGFSCVVRLWKCGSTAAPRELPFCDIRFGEQAAIGCVRFNADGTRLLATAFAPWVVRVWNVSSGATIGTHDLETSNWMPLWAWFSGDGRTVTAALNGVVARVDAPTSNQAYRELKASDPWYDSDGDYAWAVVDHHLVVRKIPDEQPVLRIAVRER